MATAITLVNICDHKIVLVFQSQNSILEESKIAGIF